MTSNAARFLCLRWLAVVLLSLLWATMGSAAALVERGDFGHSLIAAKTTKEGVYEFPDQKNPGQDYIGQAKDMDARLNKHKRDGRVKPGTETKTEVPGGKTAREIEEHKRIQKKTGGVPASKSDKVSNKKDWHFAI
jgi:hypothetical protein